jgi:hypothetical protein
MERFPLKTRTAQNPLAYPGHDLSEGAVASLIPGDAGLTSLPNPNITDASWFAIASEFIDSGSPEKSFLRSFLDKWISNTYSPGETPSRSIKTNDILGGAPNDVIVTVASQTDQALPANTKLFKGLAHTPTVPSWICVLLPHCSTFSEQCCCGASARNDWCTSISKGCDA